MSSRVIFLDFDGVLIPLGAVSPLEVGLIRSNPHAHLALAASKVSEEAIEAVVGLAARGKGCKLVVISSWRRAFPDTFIRTFMDAIGLGPYLHDHWFATFRASSSKAHDIADWLQEHPEVEQGFAIDDHDLGLDSIRQVRPDPKIGLTGADLSRAGDRWSKDALFRQAYAG